MTIRTLSCNLPHGHRFFPLQTPPVSVNRSRSTNRGSTHRPMSPKTCFSKAIHSGWMSSLHRQHWRTAAGSITLSGPSRLAAACLGKKKKQIINSEASKPLAIAGGQGGIRTHGDVAATPAFQASPFDHSGTCPTDRVLSHTLAGDDGGTLNSTSCSGNAFLTKFS